MQLDIISGARKHVVKASAQVPINARQAFEMFCREDLASKFRDIRKYTKWEVNPAGHVHAEYKVMMMPMRMTMYPDANSRTIRFVTRHMAMESTGTWRVLPVNDTACVLRLDQRVHTKLPLPVSMLQSKIERIFQDVASYAAEIK